MYGRVNFNLLCQRTLYAAYLTKSRHDPDFV